MQELQTPELQPLSMESKAALALLKYLPLTIQVIPQVTTSSCTRCYVAIPIQSFWLHLISVTEISACSVRPVTRPIVDPVCNPNFTISLKMYF